MPSILLRGFSRFTFLALIILVSACSRIDIEQPENGFVSDQKPDTFRVAFKNGVPKKLKLEMNGVDVTQLFSAVDKAMEASGEDILNYVMTGKNTFRVNSGIQNKKSVFYYDTTGPTLHILSADNEADTVSGYLDDPAGIASFTLDGVDIELDDTNHFTTSYVEKDVYEFVAVDTFGHETVNSFATSITEFKPGMTARLNNGGFAFLTDVLTTALGTIDFEKAMMAINPIFEFGPLKVNVRNMYFGKPVIDLDVNDDADIATHVDIPDFSFGLEMQLGEFPPLGGSVEMTNILVDTDAKLSIAEGDVAIALADTNVDLKGFHLDFDLIPTFIEDFVSPIIGGITNFLLDFFTKIVENAILPIISDFVGEIPIEMDLYTVEGEGIHIKALPYYLETFDNGLTIDLGSSLTANERNPNTTDITPITPQLGSHYTAGETPSLGNKTPSGKDFDFGVSISENVINQALFAAHQAGLISIAIRPDLIPGINVDPEGLSVIATEKDDIQTRDLIGIQMLPASPPFIKLMPLENAHGMLGWHDVTIKFDMKRTDWEEYKNIFSMTFDLEVPFELSATDDGFLSIGIEQLPVIKVLESSNTGAIKLTPALMNGVLDYVMPLALPFIAEKLKAVPLPSIAGYGIRPDEFWAAGSGNNNFSLAGSLIKLTAIEDAPEPTSILAFSGSFANPEGEIVPTPTPGAELGEGAPAVYVENAEAIIEVMGYGEGDETLQHRYRLDGGPWSIWKKRETIRLQRLLGGHHVVEVCARSEMLKQEENCPVVEFDTKVVEY